MNLPMNPPHAPVVLDIATPTLNADDRRRLAHPLTGGVILFSRHFESRAQLSDLCAELRACRPDVLIAVDHEGGRVQRFKTDGFTHLPAMRVLGQLWHRSGAEVACNHAVACGYVLGAELRACGVDLSFTPVLDLDHSRSEVIGNRAFDRDPHIVSALARALMQGLLQSGMSNCGKHFPGHGYAEADSHVAVPVDERSLTAILADDAAPYHWLSASLRSIMPAHVIYPAVDARPAGFSALWLQDILRGQLGFQGAVFSDDLSMEGARVINGSSVTPTEAAIAALNAGCDLVLLCNQSLHDKGCAIDALLDGLSHAEQQGAWQARAISEARRLQLLGTGHAPDWDKLHALSHYQHAQQLVSALA
jgi:beta-N-acetylhexosaminidase